ncbi:hypothetical protein AG1IA_00911 [Rhizoctonia solani AG-1 IA]|uniref:DUF4211 domain-containing protein n=1 Tax=Thanatephorus cucumeris (strain AG1-IA) TaxID=983506 RepID=L8X4C7_THACA|nr:hypothetical protein AG1IA_00911 [Rhizoctonia solani AG-1 IA]
MDSDHGDDILETIMGDASVELDSTKHQPTGNTGSYEDVARELEEDMFEEDFRPEGGGDTTQDEDDPATWLWNQYAGSETASQIDMKSEYEDEGMDVDSMEIVNEQNPPGRTKAPKDASKEEKVKYTSSGRLLVPSSKSREAKALAGTMEAVWEELEAEAEKKPASKNRSAPKTSASNSTGGTPQPRPSSGTASNTGSKSGASKSKATGVGVNKSAASALAAATKTASTSKTKKKNELAKKIKDKEARSRSESRQVETPAPEVNFLPKVSVSEPQEELEEDTRLYCVCKTRYDENKVMIACDSRCAVKGCNRPARAPTSKYCSDICGIKAATARLQTLRARGVDLDQLWYAAKDARPPDGAVYVHIPGPTPHPPPAGINHIGSGATKVLDGRQKVDLDRLAKLVEESGQLKSRRAALELDLRHLKARLRLLNCAGQRNEKVGGEKCGFDARIVMEDEDWATWLNDTGQWALEEGEGDEAKAKLFAIYEKNEGSFCTGKKRCDRHQGWQNLKFADFSAECDSKTLSSNTKRFNGRLLSCAKTWFQWHGHPRNVPRFLHFSKVPRLLTRHGLCLQQHAVDNPRYTCKSCSLGTTRLQGAGSQKPGLKGWAIEYHVLTPDLDAFALADHRADMPPKALPGSSSPIIILTDTDSDEPKSTVKSTTAIITRGAKRELHKGRQTTLADFAKSSEKIKPGSTPKSRSGTVNTETRTSAKPGPSSSPIRRRTQLSPPIKSSKFSVKKSHSSPVKAKSDEDDEDVLAPTDASASSDGNIGAVRFEGNGRLRRKLPWTVMSDEDEDEETGSGKPSSSSNVKLRVEDESEDEDEDVAPRRVVKRKTVAVSASDSEEEEVMAPKRRLIRRRPVGQDNLSSQEDDDDDPMDGLDDQDASARNNKKMELRENLARLKRRKLGHDTPPAEHSPGEGEDEDEAAIRPRGRRLYKLIPGARPSQPTLQEWVDGTVDDEPEIAASQSPSPTNDEDESEQGSGSSDNDSWIEDDTNNGAPPAILPEGYSMLGHQSLAHHFKVVMQLFVHLACLKAKQRREFRECEQNVSEHATVKIIYSQARSRHPELDIVHLKFAVSGCGACRISTRLSTFKGSLAGDDYNRDTFESRSESVDSDDSDNEESNLRFDLGRFCRARVKCYHDFIHWEVLSNEIETLKTAHRRKDPASSRGQRPAANDPDGIMNWLDGRGIVQQVCHNW